MTQLSATWLVEHVVSTYHELYYIWITTTDADINIKSRGLPRHQATYHVAWQRMARPSECSIWVRHTQTNLMHFICCCFLLFSVNTKCGPVSSRCRACKHISRMFFSSRSIPLSNLTCASTFYAYVYIIMTYVVVCALWCTHCCTSRGRVPADTKRWITVGLILVHRLRRWTSIKLALFPRLVSAGLWILGCMEHVDTDRAHSW